MVRVKSEVDNTFTGRAILLCTALFIFTVIHFFTKMENYFGIIFNGIVIALRYLIFYNLTFFPSFCLVFLLSIISDVSFGLIIGTTFATTSAMYYISSYTRDWEYNRLSVKIRSAWLFALGSSIVLRIFTNGISNGNSFVIAIVIENFVATLCLAYYITKDTENGVFKKSNYHNNSTFNR